MKTANRYHWQVYPAFCPHISTYPNIDYESTITDALKSYPGAKGDPVIALSFAAKHLDMSNENGRKHMSDLYNFLDNEAYKKLWIDHYLDYNNEN
jgi:hypothetical protein